VKLPKTLRQLGLVLLSLPLAVPAAADPATSPDGQSAQWIVVRARCATSSSGQDLNSRTGALISSRACPASGVSSPSPLHSGEVRRILPDVSWVCTRCHRIHLLRDRVSRLSDVVLTFLAGGSLSLALGFEPPRGSGYGFYVVAGCDGQNRLAARCPATTRPLIERCDWIAV